MLTSRNFLRNLMPRIVAILVLLYFGVVQLGSCMTMIVTAAKLQTISNDIVYIEQLANTTPTGWDTEAEEEYNEQIDKRNALINDSNSTVSKFASANNLQRLGQFILPFIASLILIYSGVRFIPSTIRYIKRLFKE